MTATKTTPPADTMSGRWDHRKTCILAGGLALVGGALALFVHPWFAALAAAGGIWLVFAPESKSCG